MFLLFLPVFLCYLLPPHFLPIFCFIFFVLAFGISYSSLYSLNHLFPPNYRWIYLGSFGFQTLPLTNSTVCSPNKPNPCFPQFLGRIFGILLISAQIVWKFQFIAIFLLVWLLFWLFLELDLSFLSLVGRLFLPSWSFFTKFINFVYICWHFLWTWTRLKPLV